MKHARYLKHARYSDWPARLAAYIGAVRDRPFEWGRFDCALFAAGAVMALTGRDPAAGLAGTYADAVGAARTLRALSAADVEHLATLRLGDPIPPALAQRGDVVSVDTDAGPALGVCLGGTAAVPGPAGLEFLAAPLWRHAWRL